MSPRFLSACFILGALVIVACATGAVKNRAATALSGGIEDHNAQAGPIVTVVQLADSSSGAGRAVTLGLPLGEGVLDSGTGVVVTTVDGGVLESQWNPLSRWRTDGSVLHGALTFLTPESGDNSGTYEIRTGTPSGGTVISRSDVVSAGFDAEIRVSTGGGTYSLSARDLLSGLVAARQDYVHFEGALVSEFVMGGALRANGNGAEHGTLQGYFHVRAFGRPVERVYVTTVLENTGVFNSLSDTTADVTISVGGSTRYTNSGFSIGADKRYPKRFWWNGDPGLWVSHDGEYLQDTKLVPEYREIALDDSVLNGFPSSVDWHGRGQLSSALDSGGAAAHLAPLDRWTASYLISGDRRAFEAMRAHGDAYHWVVSQHEYAMNPRDENTGFALDLAENPQAVGYSWDGIAASRESVEPMKTDMAHQPSCNYVLYLTTAEYDALEHCQLWAVANWIMERPGSYPGWPRSFYFGQVRGVGWGFRNIVHAAVVTPDNHPLKGTLDDAVVFAIDSFAEDARPLDPQGKTGLWLTGPAVGEAIVYEPDQTPNPNDSGGFATGVATWQDDFLTWAIGSAYERGYRAELDSSGAWAWKAQAVVERLGDGTRWCWANGALYALGVKDTPSSAVYPDWGTLYDKNFPAAGPCPAEGSTDVGTDRGSTDYGAQMGPAIAVAADTGIPDAAAAWQRYNTRNVNWGSDTFSLSPEWSVKRRD